MGRLRQCVKSPRLHPARNQIIARPFGRGARHERSFDFEKSLGRQVIPNGLGDFMPRLDVELHALAAQVDVAVLQSRLFVGQRRVRRQERRQLGLIQNAQLLHDEFDFAGGDVFIDGVGIAQLDGADCRDHVLIAQCFGAIVRRGIQFAVEDHLRNPAPVAQIDEDDISEVAPPVDPTHEHSYSPGVGGT